MHIIDTHCDVLLKLWEGKGSIRFSDSEKLDANKNRLQAGKVKIQFFAIFVDPSIHSEQKFQVALEQVDYFYKEVLGKNPEMKHLKNWSDFNSLKEGQIGAVLTLEGVDAIGNDLTRLHMLHQLGVLSVGLTWNNANLAADGAGEPRGAGLTLFGKEIVQFHNENKILTDVSHLSEKAFWDVVEIADLPFASHSNSRALCDHPRNLYDEQAKALFNKGGVIHVVYCTEFIIKEGRPRISDVIKHIDHFCSLGGVKQIGLGSDFDGISKFVENLEDASYYQNMINELLKHFKEDEVKGFAHQNFLNFLSGMK